MPRTGPPRREGPTWVLRRGRYRAPIVFTELPSEVPFGFLGRLLPSSATAELHVQLHRVTADRALAMLDRARAIASAELAVGEGNAEARPARLEREAVSAQEVARQVAAREQDLWRVGITVTALGTSIGGAEGLRAELARRFRAAGFRPRSPSFEVASACAAPDLQGTEARPPGYWHTLQTDGATAFFPFVEEAVIEPRGVLVGLLLEDASPVILDRWSHASYSWGVFGSTGSGKTFFTALTVLRTLWTRPEVEVVFLDPLGEFSGFTRALGGQVVGVADGREGRWNPLDPASTGGDRAEKAGRVATMLRALYPSLRDEESAILETAVRQLYEDGPAAPTFSDLLGRIDRWGGDVGRLRALLEVFRSGPLAAVDGPSNVELGGRVTAVNLLGVPESQLPFHLTYLLDAVHGHVRRHPGPKLLVLDEAHLLTRDPGTAAYLDRLVRHVRHDAAGVMILSQNPDDLLGTESGRSLARNLRATFLLRLSEVSDLTAGFLSLTQVEREWLTRARLPKETGYSEALLRFGPSHLPMALVASTPEHEFLVRALGSSAPGATPTTSGVPVQP